MNEFALDLEKIRADARAHMEQGAVTDTYTLDKKRVIEVLNDVLATELVCVARYKSHYYAVTGVHGPAVQAELLEHANDEQRHADMAADRISQLGGVPSFDPEVVAKRSHTEYGTSDGTLREMIAEDLFAERIAVSTYAEIIRWLGNEDATTRRMMEELLADEEEHADDLRDLMERLPE